MSDEDSSFKRVFTKVKKLLKINKIQYVSFVNLICTCEYTNMFNILENK